MFKVGDEIQCVITEIEKDKKRVAISHRLTQENPFEVFEKKYPVDSIVDQLTSFLQTIIILDNLYSVSYTHLTLPTIYSV